MSKLTQKLAEVREKIAGYRRDKKHPTEAETRATLINPVLRALGWDPENPADVSMEERGEGKYRPPDYVLLLHGKPEVLVEAKRLGVTLDGDKCADQLMGYAGAAAAGVEWIVLTNGDDYHIYNALAHVSSFGQRLFRAVQLSDQKSPTEETLALLSKERIGNGNINDAWQIHFADSHVHAAIDKLFSPSSDFLSALFTFVNKQVKGLLTREEIKASLRRLRASFEFPVHPTKPPVKTVAITNGRVGDLDPKHVSLLDAAAKVLEESGQPMTCKEIVELVQAKGLWKPGKGLTPAATLSAAIGHEIATKGKESRFTKTEPGHFVFNR